MVTERRRKTKKAGTLAAKKLSANKARGVRGGIQITKVMDSSSSSLFREVLTGEGKHVKIN